MTLSDLDTALRAVCPDTYQLAAPDDLQRYIVWAQSGYVAMDGDDDQSVRWPVVAIRAVCQDDQDTLFLAILDALDSLGVAYTDPGLSYNDGPFLRVMDLTAEVV